MKKILEVRPLPSYQLRINFIDGSQKLYGLYDLVTTNDFYKSIRNESKFKRVKIDSAGTGVTWGNELDLSFDELYDFEI